MDDKAADKKDDGSARKQQDAQKHLDEVPPPGTDPLHEGP